MKNFIYKIVLLLTVASVVGCGGAEERKKAYFEKAVKSYEEGAYDKARVDFRNVVQIDPKHAHAYFMLGKIAERSKEYKAAYGFYSKALQLEPENVEYLSKMGLIYLTINETDKAKENMDKILAIDPDNIDGLILQAGITYKEGDIEKATKMMEEIFYKNPGHEGNSSFLAGMYIRENRLNEARIILEETIGLNKRAILLRAMLVDLLFHQKENEKAIAELKELIEIVPEAYEYQVKLAKYYDATGNSKEAERVLRDAIKSMPNDVNRRLMLASFIRNAQGEEAAIAELKKMIDANPDVGEYKLALAAFYTSMDNKEKAKDVYRDTIKNHSKDEYGIKASINLISMLIQEDKLDAAEDVLNKALEVAPNDADLHLVKARLALLDNNLEQVIISLRTVLKEKPGEANGYLLLAEAYKNNNDEEQYNDTLNRAYNNVRTSPTELYQLAEYYIRKEEYDKAEKIIDDSLSIDPGYYDALLAKSKLLANKKDYSGAATYGEKLVVIDPALPDGYIQQLPALLSEKKYDEALELLENGYTKTNGNINILQMIANIHLDNNNPKNAINRINKAIDNSISDGRSAQYYYLLARVYLSDKNEAKAIESFQQASRLLPGWENPYTAIMRIHTSNKEYSRAESILKDGIEKVANDARLIFYLAGIYERMNKIQEAIEQYEKLYKLQPDNILAVNNLVSLLVDNNKEGDMDRAASLIHKLKSRKQIAIRDTVAWYYYKNGDTADALNIMKDVINQAPDVPVFNYHIGMIYYKLGEKDIARKHLEIAVNSKSSFIGKSEASRILSKI